MSAQFDMFGGRPTSEAAPEQRSSAGPFEFGGKTWICWIVDDGQRYEWRSECGAYAVWRDGKTFRARRGERISDREFGSLVTAMQAALADRKGA